MKKQKPIQKDSNYQEFFQEIKKQIQSTRMTTAKLVNKKVIKLYWCLGKIIVEKQDKHGWGKSIVNDLSQDLAFEFNGKIGFSVQNLWYMRQLYLEYKDHPNLQQLVGEIPWGQNLLIMSKVKDLEARKYYLSSTANYGWTRNVLLNQVNGKAYERHSGTKQNNFSKVLPDCLAEQAVEALKDMYFLDCLGISTPVRERELENRMIEKIKDVLLELGYGFCFIGNQFRLQLYEKEYFIDLLFYHRKLKCLIAIELKSGVFEPEYAGKMNFYLNILDDKVKEPEENPSIGIIMCAERNKLEVEYALRGIEKPVGVAQYILTKELPFELINQLPNVEQLQTKILCDLNVSVTLSQQQEKILEYVNKKGKITNKIYRELFNVSQSTAKRELAKMVKMNLLQKQGIGKSTFYLK